MKTIALFLVLHFSVSFSYSQSTVELDKKNGINKFKLGSAFDLYKKNLVYSLTDKSTGSKIYRYTGIDIFKILGAMQEEISLSFFKNKLYSISFYISNLPGLNDDGSEVRRRLIVLFGEPKKVYMDNYEWAYRWTGEKVILGWDKVSCNSDFKPCIQMLWVTSQSILREVEGDSF